ncbi:MAG: bifunctional diaminohydroxyphosphoribosylaminopyrimidine deaminase/5-amino-6-(5-phosphoribosylamino)uracil reductase RibD [Brachybacterium sp.]|nr:bifunctional diaminohydroxyphosphoribosylaminopyrimidine deaminase/5-amino-6-(5-phosphoribosylamino)uracil reductase RibD [Brachybacterium sp.]
MVDDTPARAATAPTPAERAAMDRALHLAAQGPAEDANPRVGCVLLDADGATLGEGYHRGAGTPHAEVAALTGARDAGHDVHGATAVVTLEPCHHTGRTGPCTEALLTAGIGRVVLALEDPSPQAGGGAAALAAAGVAIVRGSGREDSLALNRAWHRRATAEAAAVSTSAEDRCHIVLKTATTLDGRIAAADGSSRWITGPEARAHAHRVRAATDAIIVGTGTVHADNPALTARPADADAPATQPWRIVVGTRPIPTRAAVRGEDGRFAQVTSRDPRDMLAALRRIGARHAVLEGGPRLATAFLRFGIVDELHAYLAPAHLGAGAGVIGDLGISDVDRALRWHTRDVRRLGEDVLMVATRGADTPLHPRAGEDQP